MKRIYSALQPIVTMKKTSRLIISLLIYSMPASIAQTSATYDITFTSTWNATNHTSIPENAHWSKLVGATHKTSNAFLQIGNLATLGIKNIAETGNNTVFNEEVNAEILNGEADQYINGPNLGTATGNILILDLVVTEEFPLLTLVSMIAPSPDWMVAINGYNLLDPEGNWKPSVTLEMFAYDAGTDSGTDYTSGNSVTNPFEPISIISGLPFNGNIIGTLTITLKTVLGVSESPIFNKVNVYPNPVSNESITISHLTGISIKKIEILSISGLIVKSFDGNIHNSSLTLDIHNLSAGVYLMKIAMDKNETIVRKFVVK